MYSVVFPGLSPKSVITSIITGYHGLYTISRKFYNQSLPRFRNFRKFGLNTRAKVFLYSKICEVLETSQV
ncbi:Uncharacterized protein dnm_048140 [Desulfonema magnum]|uniref:Uncharacterized protein n=1 Tax=Desulfonema magnum TaxID=45655 RepID=A0A975GPE5_9BACT|nr:Uncharacterized protein dnm_048140 [Desulfonema magnum]